MEPESEYPDINDFRKILAETQGKLDEQQKRANTLEESLQKIGVLRMSVESEYADTKRKLTEELDEQRRISLDLKSKLDMSELSRAKLQDKVNRMNTELIAVMKKKYELTQHAQRDALKKLADDERIRADLAREQRRVDQSRVRSPSTPPLTQNPPVLAPSPQIIQSPISIRSKNALRELRDFFEF